jgi:FkbM family methyltransferase
MEVNLENFDWGWMSEGSNISHIHLNGDLEEIGNYHKRVIINEIYTQRVYERFFEVEQDDVVVDIGASIGPFTYSILHKKPKKVFCIEPSPREHKTLQKNVSSPNVEIITNGISEKDGDILDTYVFGNIQENLHGINFNTFIDNHNITKIDFMKTDCEGGEYFIFNDNNFEWIKDNVKKIVGEWHLGNADLKEKFRKFRDTYLSYFKNTNVYSIDGIDIKWDLWNEHFLEYYNEVIIYIDNR